jgi:hypothetical protein
MRGYLKMWRENLAVLVAILIVIGLVALLVVFGAHKGHAIPIF